MNQRLLASASKPGLGPAAELLLALPKSNQKASPLEPASPSGARNGRASQKSPECCAARNQWAHAAPLGPAVAPLLGAG